MIELNAAVKGIRGSFETPFERFELADEETFALSSRMNGLAAQLLQFRTTAAFHDEQRLSNDCKSIPFAFLE